MLTRQTKGALLISLLMTVLVVAIWLFKPYFAEKNELQTSDAGQTSQQITVRMDDWAGYFIACSPQMTDLMKQEGVAWNCVNDKADYPKRMKDMSKGEADFAVFTVDSDVLNGLKKDGGGAEREYPVSVIGIIDESSGGDSFWARSERVKNIDDLKTLKDPKVCFTPNSPSEHILKVVISSFGIQSLSWKNDAWKVPASDNSSAQAFEDLVAGKCDAAIIWEPQTSKARKTPGLVELISTKNMNRTVVDILTANRAFLRDHPDMVNTVLANYFRALKYYRGHNDELIEQMSKATGIKPEEVGEMLKGFRWVDLQDNANQWFGISQPGQPSTRWLVESIRSTVDVLTDIGDFSGNPLPNGDPYRLIFSKPVETLYLGGMPGVATQQSSTAMVNSIETKFPALTDEQWSDQREIGTLKIRPVTFMNGVSLLDLDGKVEVDKIAEAVSHSPGYRLLITGHSSDEPSYLTGPELDVKKAANIILSQQRADAVKQYLMVTYSVDSNRIRAVGVGSTKPLDRDPDESQRAYDERQRRVEVHLVADRY